MEMKRQQYFVVHHLEHCKDSNLKAGVFLTWCYDHSFLSGTLVPGGGVWNEDYVTIENKRGGKSRIHVQCVETNPWGALRIIVF